jgi:serine/threonine protein kinase
MSNIPSPSSSKRRSRPHSVVETLGATTSETKEGLRKINNYLLKKEIGRGAFGTVHLGIDENTDVEYVRTRKIEKGFKINSFKNRQLKNLVNQD